jgi:hypothetical protein
MAMIQNKSTVGFFKKILKIKTIISQQSIITLLHHIYFYHITLPGQANYTITMGDSGEESSNATAIKTMQLYSHIDRIWNELSELGYDRNDSDAIIPAKVVNMFDCYNYSGPEGAKRAAQLLCVSESSRVLDIGI